MSELRRGYLAEVAGQLARFEELVVDSIRRGELDSVRRAKLRRLAHNWKGSGGSYGFARITELAARLEFEIAAESDVAAIARSFALLRSVVLEAMRELGLR